MARKKLLTEGEIRQFMKLADLRPIGEKRLSEYGMGAPPGARDEDEDLESKLHATEDELGAEDSFADEEGAELDAADDELGLDDELGDPVGDMAGGDEAMAMELAQGFAEVMADVLGIEVAVEGEEAAPEEVEDIDLEAEVEVGPEGGEEVGLAMMDDEEVVEEPPGSRNVYENQDQIVAEVAKRVAARLQRQSRKEQMVDQLAERIMKRLTNK